MNIYIKYRTAELVAFDLRKTIVFLLQSNYISKEVKEAITGFPVSDGFFDQSDKDILEALTVKSPTDTYRPDCGISEAQFTVQRLIGAQPFQNLMDNCIKSVPHRWADWIEVNRPNPWPTTEEVLNALDSICRQAIKEDRPPSIRNPSLFDIIRLEDVFSYLENVLNFKFKTEDDRRRSLLDFIDLFKEGVDYTAINNN